MMKIMTLAAALLGAVAVSTAAYACPFMDKTDDQTAEGPILDPEEPAGT